MTAILLGGLAAVVALAEVLRAEPTAPPALVTNCLLRFVADTSWRREQLHLARLNPLPDVAAYWVPGSMSQLVEMAHAEAPIRRVQLGVFRNPTADGPHRAGVEVLAQWWPPIGRPPVTARRTPGATLIGAAA